MQQNAYHLTDIHYRDKFGALLWTAPMIFKRLHRKNEVFLHDYKPYKVLRVAVADNIVHVNIVEAVAKPGSL